MGDWAMIQKECVWDRYVGGCEVTGVSGNSVEALVKGEVTTYPHRLHRRGLLGTTDLCADWYQAVRDGEDALAAAIAAAAADEGAADEGLASWVGELGGEGEGGELRGEPGEMGGELGGEGGDAAADEVGRRGV